MEFRTLRADEIDCRVAQVTEKGCRLLLYKAARCDMTILDEPVGPARWQRVHPNQHKEVCDVSIFIEEINTWVTKEDVGKEIVIPKKKKGKHLTVLNGLALTGGLEGNFILRPVSGFIRTE